MKRYALETNPAGYDGPWPELVERPDGDLVRYVDAEARLMTLEAVRRSADRLVAVTAGGSAPCAHVDALRRLHASLNAAAGIVATPPTYEKWKEPPDSPLTWRYVVHEGCEIVLESGEILRGLHAADADAICHWARLAKLATDYARAEGSAALQTTHLALVEAARQ